MVVANTYLKKLSFRENNRGQNNVLKKENRVIILNLSLGFIMKRLN